MSTHLHNVIFMKLSGACNKNQINQFMTLEDYQVLAKIGSGKYASVYKVRRTRDSKLFALKRVPLDNMNNRIKNKSVNQAKLLQNIKHSNIIALQQICYDQSNGHLCLILQLADNDLVKYIHSCEGLVKQSFIWSILMQISSGLQYLHGHNILHRDVKTSNILLLSGNIAKISDLNVSTTLDKLNYTRTGTLSYASPEIWKGETYDSKCDIWSLGCLVYEMMTKKMPFPGQNLQEISKKIVKCQYPKIQQNYSKELKDLISFMIQINPRLRPSAKTISTICSHRLKSITSQPIAKRLKSLTPFLQRQQTQVNILKTPQQTNQRVNASYKKYNKKIVSHIFRKSINDCKNENQNVKNHCQSEKQKGVTQQLKDTTHFYKRVVHERQFNTSKLEGIEENQQDCKHVKTIKFMPKRLNKLPYQKPSRRHTEL